MKEYDPYKILKIDRDNIDINKLKKNYKKLVLKYHPDKVSNELRNKYENKFKIINKSYSYLLNKYEEDNKTELKINKVVENKDYEDDINDNKVNKYIDKKKFDIKKFNEIFEKYKLHNIYDDGYDNIMSNKELKIDNTNNISFDINSFNNKFREEKKKSTNIIEYIEPVPIESDINMSYQELGVIKKDNYGITKHYTDYKTAHIDENYLINDNNYQYKSYNDINSLKNDRSNINYKMSEEDKKKYDIQMEHKKQEELLRQKHIKYIDQMIFENYNNINIDFLK